MMLWTALVLGCATGEAPVTPVEQAVAPSPAPVEEAEAAPEEAPETVGLSGGNREPVIERVVVSPGQPTVLDTVAVKLDASDPDGTELDVRYRWEVDGEKVAERGASLALEDLSRGQRLVVTVSVSDGEAEKTVATEPIEIVNAPPQFKTDPAKITKVEGFRLEAEDPDGDTVTWTLEGAPPMMTVDARGVLHWKGSESDPAGSYVVKIKASDPNGGVGTIELPIDVAAGSKGAQAMEKPG